MMPCDNIKEKKMLIFQGTKTRANFKEEEQDYEKKTNSGSWNFEYLFIG